MNNRDDISFKIYGMPVMMLDEIFDDEALSGTMKELYAVERGEKVIIWKISRINFIGKEVIVGFAEDENELEQKLADAKSLWNEVFVAAITVPTKYEHEITAPEFGYVYWDYDGPDYCTRDKAIAELKRGCEISIEYQPFGFDRHIVSNPEVWYTDQYYRGPLDPDEELPF